MQAAPTPDLGSYDAVVAAFNGGKSRYAEPIREEPTVWRMPAGAFGDGAGPT